MSQCVTLKQFALPLPLPKGRIEVQLVKIVEVGLFQIAIKLCRNDGEAMVFCPFVLRAGDTVSIQDIDMVLMIAVGDACQVDVTTHHEPYNPSRTL